MNFFSIVLGFFKISLIHLDRSRIFGFFSDLSGFLVLYRKRLCVTSNSSANLVILYLNRLAVNSEKNVSSLEGSM